MNTNSRPRLSPALTLTLNQTLTLTLALALTINLTLKLTLTLALTLALDIFSSERRQSQIFWVGLVQPHEPFAQGRGREGIQEGWIIRCWPDGGGTTR